jgi:NADH-quinone oxidoreductase subunit N
MFDTASLMMTLPELVLTAGGLILMMVAAYAGDGAARLVGWLSVATLALAGWTLCPAWATSGEAFDGLYRADAFGAFAKVLIYVAIRAEYPILILFASAGMGLMVSAGDMLTLYVGLELNSLAAYVLASFMRQDGRSAEAGLKYFVLGALASGILLYGVSLLYGFTGSTSYAGISTALSDGLSHGELFGLVFVLAGLAFKMSPCRSTCGRRTSTKARRRPSPPSSPARPRSRRWPSPCASR